VPLANQGGKGTARATVQAHGLVSLEGTPEPGLGGVAANQGQQGNEVSGNGDASEQGIKRMQGFRIRLAIKG
jgi:hypothetical protein